MPEILMIPIAKLKPREDNLRFDADGTDLVPSIRERGILQPLKVTPNGEPGHYFIDAGHRRLDGAAKAGLSEVPCYIDDRFGSDESDHTFTMLIENLQRQDLSPIEEAHGYQRLVEMGVKQGEVAKHVGVSASVVSRRIGLLKFDDDIQKKIHAGELALERAELYLKLPTEVRAIAAANNWDNYRVERTMEKVELDKAKAKAVRAAKQAGLAVIDWDPSSYLTDQSEIDEELTTVQVAAALSMDEGCPVEVDGVWWLAFQPQVEVRVEGDSEPLWIDLYARHDEPLAIAELATHAGVFGVQIHYPNDLRVAWPDRRLELVAVAGRKMSAEEIARHEGDNMALPDGADADAVEAEKQRLLKEQDKIDKAHAKAQAAAWGQFLADQAKASFKSADVAQLAMAATVRRVNHASAQTILAAYGVDYEKGKHFAAFHELVEAQTKAADLVRLVALALLTENMNVRWSSDTTTTLGPDQGSAALAKDWGYKAPSKPRVKKVTAEPADEVTE